MMKILALLLASLLAPLLPGAAHAACDPTNSPAQSPGCWSQASGFGSSDYVMGWQPGQFPGSAVRVTIPDILSAMGGGTLNDMHLTGSLTVPALIDNGLIPIPTISSCGLGITNGGDDMQGQFIVPSGTTSCTLDFGGTYSNAPRCIFQAVSSSSVVTGVTLTKTQFGITLSSNSGSGVGVNYICIH